jgi:hypothetical protein
MMNNELIRQVKSSRTQTNSGTLLNYVGMTFDFTTAGEVLVNMEKRIDDVWLECGSTKTKVTLSLIR